MKAISPSCAQARRSSSERPPPSSSGATSTPVSASMLRAGSCRSMRRVGGTRRAPCRRRRGRERRKVGPQRRGDRVRPGVRRSPDERSSKPSEALAEAIAATAARKDQRHRRRGDRAVLVADQALDRRGPRGGRFAPGAAVRFALRRRAAEAAPSAADRRAGPRASARRRAPTVVIVRASPARRKRCTDLTGDIADQAVQHGGHQRPLLLGQALGGIEEKIEADGRQPAATRGACRRVPVRCTMRQSAILPASFAAALSDFG